MKIPKLVFKGTLVVIIGGPIVTTADRLMGINLKGNFPSAVLIHVFLYLWWGAAMFAASRD